MPRFPPGLPRPEVLKCGRVAAGDLSGCRSGWRRDSSDSTAWTTRRLNAAGLSRPRARLRAAPPLRMVPPVGSSLASPTPPPPAPPPLCPLPPSLSGTARHCHPRASTTWTPAIHFPPIHILPAHPRPAALTATRAPRPGNCSGAASCCRRGWTAHRPNASYHWLSL